MDQPMKQENRGGARPNTGPKPGTLRTLSASQVQKMLRTAKKWAKRTGKSIDDVLCSIIYNDEAKNSDRLAGIKVFKEYTAAKLQEGGEADKALGPALYLPEQRPSLSAVKTDKAA